MRRDNASQTESSSTPEWAWWAFVWSVAFGAISLYWAAGGTIGISTLAQTIQEAARNEDGEMLILTAVTGVLKIGGGMVALATIQRWGKPVPRRLLLILVWGIGGVYTLYGVANFIDKALMATGVRSVPDAVGEDVVLWYLVLWEPFWTLGGVLFLLTAWSYQRSAPVRGAS